MQEVSTTTKSNSSSFPKRQPSSVYYFEDGLRCVEPYYFEFTSYVKGRWVGRTVMDIYTKEFQFYNEQYVKKGIELQRFFLDGKVVTNPNLKLKNLQQISHKVHRHELPVLDCDIEFLRCDDDYVVINKPHSIPIHPCGRYRENTILHILKHEYNLACYRLDRLTSGVLIMAKNSNKAKELGNEIMERKIDKVYLARAKGKFHTLNKTFLIDEPLSCEDRRLGIWKVGNEKGNPSQTLIYAVHYDEASDNTIFLCKLITGRTHQIRLHLQWIDHFIANDPDYGFYIREGRKAKKLLIDPESLEYGAMPPTVLPPIEEEDSSEPSLKKRKIDENTSVTTKEEEKEEKKEEETAKKPVVDPLCFECRLIGSDERSFIIYLHAWVYNSEELKMNFKSNIPKWVTEIIPDTSIVESALETIFADAKSNNYSRILRPEQPTPTKKEENKK